MATMTAVDPPVEGGLAWKIDRSDEPDQEHYKITDEGPWTDEPDKVQWVDPDTGLDCLIVRNRWGSLCGYVGVPADHPAYEHPDYDDLPVSVHGGITFSGKCSPEAKAEAKWVPAPDCPVVHDFGEEGWRPTTTELHEHLEEQAGPGICHVPFPGRPHDIFWLGFDCGHGMDYQPGMASFEKRNFPSDLLEQMSRPGRYTPRYRNIAYVVGECTDLAKQLVYIAEENA